MPGEVVHTPVEWPASVVGMAKLMVSTVADALASWIAARSVHSGAPSLLVPPVSQTSSPGAISGRSDVELTAMAALNTVIVTVAVSVAPFPSVMV